MSLLFGPQLFAITAEPLARSVALAALRITVVVVANDLTGPATDDWTNALPRPKVLVLLHDPCDSIPSSRERNGLGDGRWSGSSRGGVRQQRSPGRKDGCAEGVTAVMRACFARPQI